jgi:hypothetical protein
MNWNQTRLDGRMPVTIRTANQVKSILRFCAPNQAIAIRYAIACSGLIQWTNW